MLQRRPAATFRLSVGSAGTDVRCCRLPICFGLQAHRQANDGAWPETVAVNLWGLDSIKTKGESGERLGGRREGGGVWRGCGGGGGMPGGDAAAPSIHAPPSACLPALLANHHAAPHTCRPARLQWPLYCTWWVPAR